MSIDPDFVVTIDGQNVNKYVWSWKLHDKEKGTSTLEVVLKNPDQVLSNKFANSKTISLLFGYTGNYGDKVTMDIKKFEESYSVEEPKDFIKITGMDAKDALNSANLKSGGTDKNVGKPPVDTPGAKK